MGICDDAYIEKKESSKIKEEQICEKAESDIAYTAVKMLSSARIGTSRQRNRVQVGKGTEEK